MFTNSMGFYKNIDLDRDKIFTSLFDLGQIKIKLPT